MKPTVQVFVDWELRDCNPGKERTYLDRQMKLVRKHDDQETPAQRPDKHGVRLARGPCKRLGEQVACGDKRKSEQ